MNMRHGYYIVRPQRTGGACYIRCRNISEPYHTVTERFALYDIHLAGVSDESLLAVKFSARYVKDNQSIPMCLPPSLVRVDFVRVLSFFLKYIQMYMGISSTC